MASRRLECGVRRQSAGAPVNLGKGAAMVSGACYWDPKRGRWVCPTKNRMESPSSEERESVAAVLSDLGVSRPSVEVVRLAYRVLKEVADIASGTNRLDDPEIKYRGDEVVGAMQLLLQRGDPPSLLAFHFSTLPGRIVVLSEEQVEGLMESLEEFKTPKPRPKKRAKAKARSRGRAN